MGQPEQHTPPHVSTQHQNANQYAYHPEQHQHANTYLESAQPQLGPARYRGAQRYATQQRPQAQRTAAKQRQRPARPSGPRRQRPHPSSDLESHPQPEHKAREYYEDIFARELEEDLVARHHKVNWGKVEGVANTVSNVVGTGVKVIGTFLDHLRREDVEELFARGDLDDELVARDIDEEFFARALEQELVARKVNIKKVGHVLGDIAKTALHFIPFFKREDGTTLVTRDFDERLYARAIASSLVARKVNLKKVGHVVGDIAKTALHFLPFFKREEELYARGQGIDLDELVARETYIVNELD